jgi:hypothetical protein
LNPEALHQQHVDFLKKYNAGLLKIDLCILVLNSFLLAKAKLESQLEAVRNQESINGIPGHDINKRV